MKIETDASFYKTDSKINYQRSSALKSFTSCSWLYYCNYFLKIPQADNQGALQGNVCHSFFECLLEKRRKPIFKVVMKAGTTKASPSAYKLVKRLIKRNKLPATDEIFDRIDKMILVGLKSDFYVAGGKIVGKEYRFKIENKEPRYNIYGTIDKISLIKKTKVCQIDDYKSSKVKYSGEDKESGIQALVYSLACKKIWPEYKPIVRFHFLQFPDEPVQEVSFTDETLMGFEHYLAETQIRIDAFSEKSAYLNFAADEPIPADGSFGGRLSCGFAKRPNQMKKDGSPMWACPFKFAFTYFIVKKNEKFVSAHLKKENIILKDGETIESNDYQGCPRYRDIIPDTAISKTNTVNVLDDF
jgi:ATP-dependent helicase/DNAse subunit B